MTCFYCGNEVSEDERIVSEEGVAHTFCMQEVWENETTCEECGLPIDRSTAVEEIDAQGHSWYYCPDGCEMGRL